MTREEAEKTMTRVGEALQLIAHYEKASGTGVSPGTSVLLKMQQVLEYLIESTVKRG